MGHVHVRLLLLIVLLAPAAVRAEPTERERFDEAMSELPDAATKRHMALMRLRAIVRTFGPTTQFDAKGEVRKYLVKNFDPVFDADVAAAAGGGGDVERLLADLSLYEELCGKGCRDVAPLRAKLPQAAKLGAAAPTAAAAPAAARPATQDPLPLAIPPCPHITFQSEPEKCADKHQKCAAGDAMACREMYSVAAYLQMAARRRGLPGHDDVYLKYRYSAAACQLGSSGGCRDLAGLEEKTDNIEPAKIKAMWEERLRYMNQGCAVASAAKSYGYVELCNLKQSYGVKVAQFNARMAKGIERPGDHVEEVTALAKAKGRDLRGMDFSNKRLKGIDLSGAKLDKANFTGAYLGLANLSKASLKGAIFDRTNLVKTNLRGAQLESASFKQLVIDEADLTQAQMNGAVFEGVTLDGVNLNDAQLPNVRFVNSTITGTLPSFNVVDGTLSNLTIKKARIERLRTVRTTMTEVTFVESELPNILIDLSKISGLTSKKSTWNGGVSGSQVTKLVIEDSTISRVTFSASTLNGGRVTATSALLSFDDFSTFLDVNFCSCPGCRVSVSPKTKFLQSKALCLDTAMR